MLTSAVGEEEGEVQGHFRLPLGSLYRVPVSSEKNWRESRFDQQMRMSCWSVDVAQSPNN